MNGKGASHRGAPFPFGDALPSFRLSPEWVGVGLDFEKALKFAGEIIDNP